MEDSNSPVKGVGMELFSSYRINNLELKNKVVMPPMCMYSSDESGQVNEFHINHYTTRAVGGVGLLIVEATGVTPNGRISDRDLGIWEESQVEGLKRIVTAVKAQGSKIAIQLNHGGRKYTGREELVAPSPIALDNENRTPRELTKEEIKSIIENFSKAAIRSAEAGFDAIEIHGAHGYLIHQFLSPLTNNRIDEYGGSLENRVRFLKEILIGIRDVLKDKKPILLRISASDYLEGGITPLDMVHIINLVKEDLDIVHVSSGGLCTAHINVFPGYQVEFAKIIKEQCNIPTIAVGLITDAALGEEILTNGSADLIAYGRELLRNPYFVLQEAQKHKVDIDIPVQYKRAF
ncbi:MAG: dehydrogenase NamA [Anaerocolumna sp.]|jgi:NADPH2 dehydrogenase|nr:dehydrogenase NamA [Anaerocolumna sp.]